MLSIVFRKVLFWIRDQPLIPDPLPAVDTFSLHLFFFPIPAFQIAGDRSHLSAPQP